MEEKYVETDITGRVNPGAVRWPRRGARLPETPEGIFAPYVAGDIVAEIVGELPQGIGNITFSPDGVSYNPNDGHMYVDAPQLAQLGLFNNGTNYSAAPYYMFRFKPLTESAMGR